jgi:hypothetical protein
MADLADMLVQSALQTTANSTPKIAENFNSGVQIGAQLAQQVETAQQNRIALEERKQKLQIDKIGKVMDSIEKGHTFKDKAAQSIYFKKHVPGMIKALKLEEFFGGETLEYVQQSPEARAKLIGLRLDIQDKINRGELRGSQIIEYAQSKLSDPEELMSLDTDSLLEQQKFANSEEGKSYRSQLVQQGQNYRQGTEISSTGQKTLAKKIATDWGVFNTENGFSGAQSKIKKLERALEKLKSGKVKTGTISKAAPGTSSDRAQAFLDPEYKALADDVRGAISLKGQLDSQFSAKEAEIQFNRAIDPALPNKQNIQKVEDMLNELKTGLDYKIKEFESQGYKIDRSTRALTVSTKQKEDFKKMSPVEQQRAIQGLMKKFDVPIEDVKKALGL